MPYSSESVPAALYFEYRGVQIFHTYKDDDIEQGPREYWFVTDEYGNEDAAFDVRDLASQLETQFALGFQERLDPAGGTDKWRKDVLRAAIEHKLIPEPVIDEKPGS